MDAWLKPNGQAWPKTPQASLALDHAGVPRLTVTPDSSQPFQRVELFYALENRNPKNRFWRSAKPDGTNRAWTASLPMFDPGQPLFAFANVFYTSGICLGSPLVTAVPSKLGPAKATDSTSLLIDDFSQGTGDWVTRSPATDPVPPVPCLLTNRLGPDDKTGISVTRSIPLGTHKIGDPKWRGPDGAALQFRIHAAAPRELKVSVYENEFALGAKEFTAARKLTESAQWQTLTFRAEDFKTEQGTVLANRRKANMLELSSSGSGSEPLYTDFRWLR